MKRLFYIFHDKLGENLFATPCLEFLSKDYELFVLMKEWMVPFFKDYTFIQRIIPLESISNHKSLFEEKESWYAYHNDIQENFFPSNYPNVKPYGIIHDKNLDLFGTFCDSNRILSRTRHYTLKLRISEPLDFSIRVPRYVKKPKNESVIVYQGSRESVRKLSINSLKKFYSKFPNAIYLINEQSQIFSESLGMKFVVIDPITPTRYDQLIDLFISGPRCMIGPDSALTHLALGYEIPQLWLQTRIKWEQVTDPRYKSLCKIYSRKNLSCDQKCIGCSPYISIGDGLYEIQGKMNRHQKLNCVREDKFSCLEYTDKDIENIYAVVAQW